MRGLSYVINLFLLTLLSLREILGHALVYHLSQIDLGVAVVGALDRFQRRLPLSQQTTVEHVDILEVPQGVVD